MKFSGGMTPSNRGLLALVQLTAMAALGIGLWLAGCSPNDPFDPDSLENVKPVVRMSMTPADTGIAIQPTSYFNRTFHWSGSDRDGWVTEFHIAILADAEAPAVWSITQRTDTTMSFATDANGEAEATFLLACRDNRGAMSDTLVQFIPLRNFPPAVNFKSDFNPLINMQRELLDINGEITENPSDAVDTTYWNWGAMNFRLFALDLDGMETMDSFFRYTLRDPSLGDPEITYESTDPDADPTEGWIRSPFQGLNAAGYYDINLFLPEAPVGEATTLTVSVVDEALADTRFTYAWEVREPAGPVLYIPDNSGPQAKAFYRQFLAEEYGEGAWNEFSFWFGYPDHSFVLLESMRKFQAVLWADGGSTSPRLEGATQTGGVLQQYLRPTNEETEAGHLLLISKGVIGTTSKIPHPFLKNVLGINPSPSPVTVLTTVAGKQALGLQPFLPAITSVASFGQAMGLQQPTEDDILKAEPIFQMEWCRRCYSTREPYDPVVGMRFPDRLTETVARSVTLTLQLEYFNNAEAFAALAAVLSEELGVSAP
jgi:hypothetical protein